MSTIIILVQRLPFMPLKRKSHLQKIVVSKTNALLPTASATFSHYFYCTQEKIILKISELPNHTCVYVFVGELCRRYVFELFRSKWKFLPSITGMAANRVPKRTECRQQSQLIVHFIFSKEQTNRIIYGSRRDSDSKPNKQVWKCTERCANVCITTSTGSDACLLGC